MQRSRLLVTDAAELPPRQATGSLIMTLGRNMKRLVPFYAMLFLALFLSAGCTHTSTGQRIEPPTELKQAGYPFIFVRFDGASGKAYSDVSEKKITVSIIDNNGKTTSHYSEKLTASNLSCSYRWDGMQLQIEFRNDGSDEILAERIFSFQNGSVKKLK